MNVLKKFYNKIIKYDIVNSLLVDNTKKLPKVESIVLNFNYRTTDLRNLSSGLLALELVTGKKGLVTKAKKSNLLFKIRKGDPAGCKVVLRKKQLNAFTFKILTELLPRLKNFGGFNIRKVSNGNSFSYKINDALMLVELKNHYHLFNNLSNLNLTVVTNCRNKLHIIFLLRSFQYPIVDNSRAIVL